MKLETLEEIHLEIQTKWKTYEDYAEAKDVDGILEILSDDPFVVINLAGKFEDRKVLKSQLEHTIGHFKDIEFTSKHVYDVGDKIYEIGTVREVFNVEGKDTIMEGGYIGIWINEKGDWKLSQMLVPPNPNNMDYEQ